MVDEAPVLLLPPHHNNHTHNQREPGMVVKGPARQRTSLPTSCCYRVEAKLVRRRYIGYDRLGAYA